MDTQLYIAYVNSSCYICNMKDRIRKLLLSEGLTSGSFADEIGVQRSSLSHILNGRNNPSLDFVIKSKNRFPRLSLTWLILGTGEMYPQDNKGVTLDNIQLSSSPTIFNAFPEEALDELPAESLESTIDISRQEISKTRQVDKIVIFYSDQTFSTYIPEKMN